MKLTIHQKQQRLIKLRRTLTVKAICANRDAYANALPENMDSMDNIELQIAIIKKFDELKNIVKKQVNRIPLH